MGLNPREANNPHNVWVWVWTMLPSSPLGPGPHELAPHPAKGTGCSVAAPAWPHFPVGLLPPPNEKYVWQTASVIWPNQLDFSWFHL